MKAHAPSIQAPTSASTIDWNDELIRKYDLTGPRYTSYPTALSFDDHYSEESWRRAVTEANDSEDAISIYLHIPFCDTICYYCGCNKVVTANRTHAERYLKYLKKEISIKAAEISPSVKVDLIHFGGGTPTYLSDAQLEEILLHIRSKFRLDQPALECAIEIHPQTVPPRRLKKLREMGFNRLSIGVQDFNEHVQKAVNRYNSKKEVHALINEARSLQFQSISVDLIYGLPLQSVDSVSSTLNDILDLSPDRISLFNYAHMPEMFKSQRQIKAEELPEPQDKLRMLENSIHTLEENGYSYIGMDHFAKHGDELAIAQKAQRLHRNFQGYTAHGHAVLHAFGLSAISTVDHHYVQNVKQLDQYYAKLDVNQLPIEKGYVLSQDDIMRRSVINSLICHFELDFTQFQKQFKVDFLSYFASEIEALQIMQGDGLIEINDARLTIPPCGRLLVRSVCKVFDRYANNSQVMQKRFSRII